MNNILVILSVINYTVNSDGLIVDDNGELLDVINDKFPAWWEDSNNVILALAVLFIVTAIIVWGVSKKNKKKEFKK